MSADVFPLCAFNQAQELYILKDHLTAGVHLQENDAGELCTQLAEKLQIALREAEEKANIQVLASFNCLRDELNKTRDLVVYLDEKLHNANSNSLILLNHLKEYEREIDVLKDYIYKPKNRDAIYIPV